MTARTLTADREDTMVYHTAVAFPRQAECPGSLDHGRDHWVSLSWERSAVPEGAVGAEDQTIPQEIQKTDCSFILISLVLINFFFPVEALQAALTDGAVNRPGKYLSGMCWQSSTEVNGATLIYNENLALIFHRNV